MKCAVPEEKKREFNNFSHCRKYLEHYIDHMPIETQRKAEKILTICEKRNMAEQGKFQGERVS